MKPTHGSPARLLSMQRSANSQSESREMTEPENSKKSYPAALTQRISFLRCIQHPNFICKSSVICSLWLKYRTSVPRQSCAQFELFDIKIYSLRQHIRLRPQFLSNYRYRVQPTIRKKRHPVACVGKAARDRA